MRQSMTPLKVDAATGLRIVHGFKMYSTPLKGIFRCEKPDGKYLLPGGWEKVMKEYLIIGETKTSYVSRLIPSETGYWVGNRRWTEKYILPVGIHKSRLVRWVTAQLRLFE